MKYLFFGAALVLIVGLISGAYYFLRNVTGSEAAVETAIAVEDARVSEQVLSVDMVASEVGFVPGEIKVLANQRVELTFKNNSDTLHALMIEGTDYKTMVLEKGEIETLVFSFDKAGKYVFYSSILSQRENGFEGVIVVE